MRAKVCSHQIVSLVSMKYRNYVSLSPLHSPSFDNPLASDVHTSPRFIPSPPSSSERQSPEAFAGVTR